MSPNEPLKASARAGGEDAGPESGRVGAVGDGRGQAHGAHEHGALRFSSHSQIYYYWPVWLVSLAFALVTLMTGKPFVFHDGTEKLTVRLVTQPGLGLAYLIVLVSVIFFTSVNIRGIWAALLGAVMVIVGLLFSLFNLWGPVLRAIGGLGFYINFDFYLWVGLSTLALWLLVVLIFDKRRYIEIRPTQVTVVEEIGHGEKNFDMVGLVFDKQRDNFFQHFLLGFGSGDLVVTTAGGQREQIYLPNVLRVGKRLAEIQRLREQRGH